MKNIPPSSLPTFYGKINEYQDTFLFEFDILCRSYNYLQDAHNLKNFPATLKDSALRWFMGVRESSIRTWEDMKTTFLWKYQENLKLISLRYNNSNTRPSNTISRDLSIHYINLNITTFEKMQYEHSSLKRSQKT